MTFNPQYALFVPFVRQKQFFNQSSISLLSRYSVFSYFSGDLFRDVQTSKLSSSSNILWIFNYWTVQTTTKLNPWYCILCSVRVLLNVYTLLHPQFKYMISYIHNFVFIFPGYITNRFNDQLPVRLLAQSVKELHRYHRGQGLSPGKPDFFRLSFRNCLSCVHNCKDLLFIYSSSAVEIYDNHFICSLFHLHLPRVYNEPI